MNNIEALASSSTGTVSKAPSEFRFDIAIAYIGDILSRLGRQNVMAPIASDFSKLYDGISDGAKQISSGETPKYNLSIKVQTIVSELLKGLGNAHWAGAALFAIASVLERLDKISTNNRNCIDLLKSMLDLAKYNKKLVAINGDLDSDMSAKMNDGLHLIFRASILCHSYITCTKLSKFIMAKSIDGELVDLRDKVKSLKLDLLLLLNIERLKSLNSDTSRQHHPSVQRQQSTDSDELAEILETENHATDSEIEWEEFTSPAADQLHNHTRKKQCKLMKKLGRPFCAVGRF
ncbi:hypothetical protein SUGI_0702350 [Cryptomeria japonica]|nr:hypothetical protein SUGI_0702350 [Cryptomeria japonica]